MTQERNSFKRLDDDVKLPPNAEQNLNASMSFLNSVSRVIELYLPGFFQLMISMSGGGESNVKRSPRDMGEIKKDNESYPSEPPM